MEVSSIRTKEKEMKKKLLAVLLVAALVLTALSAKEVGVKVGAELGWGFDIVKTKATGTVAGKSITSNGKYNNSGFAGNLTAEYALSDYFSVKGSFGLMFAGQTKTTSKTGDSDAVTATRDEKAGTYFDIVLDAKYTVSLAKDLNLSALAGIEMVSGHILKTDDEDLNKDYSNFAFGINAGAEVTYAINKNVDLNLGCSFAWLFVNNAKALKESNNSTVVGGTTLMKASYSATSFYIRPYVGATYSF